MPQASALGSYLSSRKYTKNEMSSCEFTDASYIRDVDPLPKFRPGLRTVSYISIACSLYMKFKIHGKRLRGALEKGRQCGTVVVKWMKTLAPDLAYPAMPHEPISLTSDQSPGQIDVALFQAPPNRWQECVIGRIDFIYRLEEQMHLLRMIQCTHGITHRNVVAKMVDNVQGHRTCQIFDSD